MYEDFCDWCGDQKLTHINFYFTEDDLFLCEPCYWEYLDEQEGYEDYEVPKEDDKL